MKTIANKKIKIVFFNNRRDLYPPLGLCFLSAALKTKGYHNISLVDRLYENNKGAARAILRAKPDIVGISTYSAGIHDIIEVSKLLKKYTPATPIIWGGPHITSLPGNLPSCADIGIVSEGEETFIEVIEELVNSGNLLNNKNLKNIRGISFHDGNKVHLTEERHLASNLDALPHPDYSILDIGWYTAPKRYFIMPGIYRGISIISSRGCPYSCIYCQASKQWKKIRYHSPLYVVNAILKIKKDYPYINAINIVDDLFTADKKRLIKIAELMKEAGVIKGISYNVNGRSDVVDEEILRILKSINVVQIGYGFESNSQKILSYLKKNTASVEDNERAAYFTNKYSIGVGGQFMIGTPGETRQDILKTIDFIKRHAMSHAHLSITTPLPGTLLWEYAKEKKLVSEDMDWRKVDFGNPDNPDLVYINNAMCQTEFIEMKNIMQNICQMHNKPSTLYEKFQIMFGKRFAWKSIYKLISSKLTRLYNKPQRSQR